MEPAPALAAAADPAAGAPLAAAVQPSTRKRRGWLSQLPTSASDTPALPSPYVELAVESPDGDVQPCLIVDPALPLRDTLLCLDLPRGLHLRLDGNRLDTAPSRQATWASRTAPCCSHSGLRRAAGTRRTRHC